MIAIDDPALPGLSALDAAALARITGTGGIAVERLRYREGRRAILHLSSADGTEGALWFYAGDRARRIARDQRAATFDAATAALYERFPQDHRLPEIRLFLERWPRLAPGLIGGRARGEPRLMRYRPGLSCTFRCTRADGAVAFVKLIREEAVGALALFGEALARALSPGPVGVAPVLGTDPAVSAIAYACAPGRPLDAALAAAGSRPIGQAMTALGRLWQARLTPPRTLTADTLRSRARDCLALACATVPDAVPRMARVLARIEAGEPRLPLRPIHGDVKLEHIFIDGERTTLIDTESLSLGPPDYDLAQLDGRLWQAEAEGALPAATVAEASGAIRRSAGPGFDWCRNVVALRLAKFHAQRPGPAASARIGAILDRLA